MCRAGRGWDLSFFWQFASEAQGRPYLLRKVVVLSENDSGTRSSLTLSSWKQQQPTSCLPEKKRDPFKESLVAA